MPNKSKTAPKKPAPQKLRDMDLEISFLEGLVAKDANYAEALQILGDDYTRRGRYADGLRVDLQLCRLRPEDALVRYNLACSYSLLDQPDLAIESLEHAITLGYRDFKWMNQDPDLEKIRSLPAYRKLQARIRQLRVKAG